jgi:adhesin/invasin
VVYTATARDAGGNVITGATFNVSASGSASTQAQITGVSNGVATLYVTDTKSGTVNVTVSLANAGTINASDSVTFIADSSTARVEEGNLVVTSDGALADLTDTNTIVATVTDQYGNIVQGVSVSFTTTALDGSGQLSYSTNGPSDSAGQVTLTLRSQSPRRFSATPVIAGVTQAPTVAIFFAGRLSILTATQNNAVADGVETNTVTARVVYPTQNTGLSGVTVTFRASGGGVISEETVVTNSSGYANATLTSLTSGTVTVTASIAARTPQELTVDTTFIEP